MKKLLQLSDKDPTQILVVLRTMIDYMRWSNVFLSPDCGKVEPPDNYKIDGFVAYADGTNWNPNSEGKGFYRWNTTTTAWVKIG